ncbi:MAG: alpha/beta fold hydrolase [Microthrixaceae bacterium]
MDLQTWREQGDMIDIAGDELFLVDRPARSAENGPPVLVIHGFPTSSVDWAPVLDSLSSKRRVVLFDLPGFGLSAKPDRRYGIHQAADAVAGVVEHLGLAAFDLVTHDMGDTVGGEVLARDLEGNLGVAGKRVEIRRRVVTNGSIYLELANLTPGQQMLWGADDARLPEELTPAVDALHRSLLDTMAPADSPASNPDDGDVRAAAEGVCHNDGASLLPRLIRYLDDRRDDEARFTGAIESHPSPLGIVWGDLDPIAVIAMAHRLAEHRDDATLIELTGVGHYPMVEQPNAFAEAVVSLLDGEPRR